MITLRRHVRSSAAVIALVLVVLCCAGTALAATPRVVALTPFSANVASLLGVRPLAIGQTLGGEKLFARGLDGVPRLALAHPFGPNLEELQALGPELVLSAPVWAKGNELMRSELGLQVAESDPTSVAAVAPQLVKIGRLLGHERPARSLAAVQSRRVAFAKRAIRRRPTVLLLLCVGDQLLAFTPRTWGGDVVRQAGGTLLTRRLPLVGLGFARISDEFVAALDPDVIIAVPHGDPRDLLGIAKRVASNPAWRGTTAAKSRRVYVSTDGTLLQPPVGTARLISELQRRYLHNR